MNCENMKKGQAAIEFIMTYGWAILAVLVAIGALSYFGIMSPSKYFPEKCIFPAGVHCKDFRVYQGSSNNLVLQLTIENKLQEAVNLQSVVIHSKNNACTNGDCVNITCIPAATIFTQDVPIKITCILPQDSSPGVGLKAIMTATITYAGIQGGFSHPVNGDIQANIQTE